MSKQGGANAIHCLWLRTFDTVKLPGRSSKPTWSVEMAFTNAALVFFKICAAQRS